MPRQEKKGGVNLPRHRVEPFLTQKSSTANTCPDRKKKEEQTYRGIGLNLVSLKKNSSANTCLDRKKKEE